MNKKQVILLVFLLSLLIIACGTTKSAVSNNNDKVENDISYEYSIKPIVENYCITCHSSENSLGGFALTSYEAVRKHIEQGELLDRINNKQYPMPEDGLMPLENRELIEKWAKNGFKKSGLVNQSPTNMEQNTFTPPIIEPIDINQRGFDFFDLMQGHWIGEMDIMGQNYEWFAFDYRAISPAHVHGIYEGGTVGNLLTSFFITEYKGKRTIMSRNGGILNGMYRMSYFVLDKVELEEDRKYFRLVDAYGGKDIMWMELEFEGEKLQFNSYTSRFGLNGTPKKHMDFNAIKKSNKVALKAASEVNYPQNIIDKEFPDSLPMANWGEKYPFVTSASYINRNIDKDLVSLGKLAGDPYNIEDIPYLSSLEVNIEQNALIKDKNLIIYLSKVPLTNKNGQLLMEYGFVKQELFDQIFLFPNITANQEKFTFHYLHPGEYYITIIADSNKNGFASKDDVSSKSIFIEIPAKSSEKINVKDINVEN